MYSVFCLLSFVFCLLSSWKNRLQRFILSPSFASYYIIFLVFCLFQRKHFKRLFYFPSWVLFHLYSVFVKEKFLKGSFYFSSSAFFLFSFVFCLLEKKGFERFILFSLFCLPFFIFLSFLSLCLLSAWKKHFKSFILFSLFSLLSSEFCHLSIIFCICLLSSLMKRLILFILFCVLSFIICLLFNVVKSLTC